MDGTKKYLIVINGIQESIDAVNSLNNKLNELSTRIDEINAKSINVVANGNVQTPTTTTTSASATKSRTSDLEAEERVLQQIEQTERKIAEAETDAYKELLRQKDALKEIKAEQKAFAGAEKLGIDPSAIDTSVNSMAALKQELKDLKAVINATDMNSPMFQDLIQRANELNTKLKDIEAQYGQFGRNVGNYASAAQGFKEVSVVVGDVERKFNSARQAGRELEQELKAMVINGKENTKEFKDLAEALHNYEMASKRAESAVSDLKRTSKGMDQILDMMQSFSTIASIGQGFQGLFGIDNNEVTRSIQKMVALQNVMKGIEVLRNQINTGEGIGKIFKGVDKIIENVAAKTNALTASLNGASTASKGLSASIKGIAVAAKALMSIGIVAAITAASFAIEKIVGYINKWVKGNSDLVNSEKLLQFQLNLTNEKLQENIKLNQLKYDSGNMTATEKRIADEKAYADALADTIELIKRRMRLNSDNEVFADYASGKKGNKDIYADKGNPSHIRFTEGAGNDEELINRYKQLNKAVSENTECLVKNAKGQEVARLSVTATKDELNRLDQMFAGKLINSLQGFNLKTEEGRNGLKKFVQTILNNDSTLYKSVLLRLPEIVSNEQGGLSDSLNALLSITKQFVSDFNTETAKLNFDNYVNGIINAADKTKKAMFQQQRDTLNMWWNSLDEFEKQNLENIAKRNKALKIINKNEKEHNANLLKQQHEHNKQIAKEIEDSDRELIQLRIEAMRDGLTKTLAQLRNERQQRITEAETSGRKVNEKVAAINELYMKKEFEARKAYHEKMLDEERKYAEEMASVIDSTFNRQIENSLANNDSEYFKSFSDSIKKITSDNSNINKFVADLNLDYWKEPERRIKGYQREIEKLEDEQKNINKILEVLKESNDNTFDGKPIEEYKKQYDELNEKINEQIALINKEAEANEDGFRAYRNAMFMATNEFEEAYKLRRNIRNKFFEDALKEYQKYVKKEQSRREVSIIKENDDLIKEEEKRYNRVTSNIFKRKTVNSNEGSFKSEDFVQSEEIESRFQLIIKQVENFREAVDKEVLDGLNTDKLRTYFSDYATQFNKWIDETRNGLEKGKLNWKDYSDYFNSELMQTYLKTYDDYSEFMKKYNSLPKAKQDKQKAEYDEWLNRMRDAYIEYLTNIQNQTEIHENALKTIIDSGNKAIEDSNAESQKKQSQATTEFYEQQIRNVEAGLNGVNSQITNLKGSRNQFDLIGPIVDLGRLKNLKNTIKVQLDDIAKIKEQFLEKFKKGEIDLNMFDNLMAQAQTLENQLKYTFKDIEADQKQAFDSLVQNINQYVQAGLQAVQSVMNSVADYEDYQFDKMQEQLDKLNEELDKKLQIQEEIVKQHKNNIESIEDELASARGDRRQYLIDQLNNEISAQREAAAEEKKIQKEQEAAERKQEKLDKKRKEAEYKRNLMSILVSTAMATANGLATQPFVPVGIAMGALATSLGMIQYALAAKQKPYMKSGGLLEGPSHENGGVKVYGGYAELEGMEYIINKRTTIQNEPLLEFINSKKKRLNLEDMVEFYGGKTVRNNIKNIGNKYANGGVLTTPTIDLTEIGDRTILIRDDATYQVSVVDINNAQNNLKAVQVLAGLQ